MISIEQKNRNILSRFEDNKTGTETKVYNIVIRGDKASMICSDGESLSEARKICESKFGKAFEGISEN